MKITLICSCGLLIDHNGQKLLVDGLMEQYPPFYRQSDEEIEALVKGEGKYAGLVGLLYSHLHPDHYDAALTEELERRQGVPVYRPSWDDPETHTLQMGPFSIECIRFAHTPVVKRYSGFAHYVFRITAGGQTVYVTADAIPDAQKHAQILQRPVDVAFWNSQNLSYAEIRALMLTRAGWNYVYHLPIPTADGFGYCKKCETNFRRYPDELRKTTLLLDYPSSVEI